MPRHLGDKDKKKRLSRTKVIGLTSTAVVPVTAGIGYASAFRNSENTQKYLFKQKVNILMGGIFSKKQLIRAKAKYNNKFKAAFKVRNKYGLRRAGLAGTAGLAASIGLGNLAYHIAQKRQQQSN